MKAVKPLIVLLIGIVLGSAGSVFLMTQGTARALITSGQRVPFEIIVTPQTFSEAANAKAVLQAVATQWVQDTHAEMARISKTRRAGDSGRAEEMLLLQSIEWIDKGVHELKGTDAEDTMQSYLLSLLLRAQLHDRWLDLYLDVLYRNPTRDLIGRWAREALAMARRADREEEVARAFRHVAAIPFDFSSKDWVDNALEFDRSKREALSGIHPDGKDMRAWSTNTSGIMMCATPPRIN